MNARDWKWIVSILSGVIVYLLSYKFWGKTGNLTEIISIGSGLAGIALAIVAIIIAVAEGVKTSDKEKKVEGALDSIIKNLRKMKKLINKLDSDNSKTHNELSKLNENVEAYIKYYDEPEVKEPEVKENQKTIFNHNIIKRADVFFADLSPVIGSEQGGIRPVVILQHDIGNRFSPTVTVALITAQIQKAKLPTHVEIDSNHHGFDRDSVILLEQIRTIDKIRLMDKITHLEDDIMKKVEDALSIQLGLIG